MDVVASWISQQLISIPSFALVLLALALLISSLGFYRTVYFISVGYAFSITGMDVISVLIYREHLTWIALLQSALLLIWSVRLGVFLVRREAKTSYGDQRQRSDESTAKVTRKIQFFIWISVSLLYVAMFSPSLFVLAADVPPESVLLPLIGLIVMAAGLVLEALADQQKSAFKATFPKNFCNVGLYRRMRCPNYFGEILFWLGNWVAAAAFYASALQAVISLIGLVCIVLIMLGSTKRLERSQDERYGSLPDYQTYVHTVPVLLPFVPIYTLKHIRFYLE